jgi:DegV family protein with EDD domain
MRVGLIVDSACDLPFQHLKDNNVFILPITVRIDGQVFVDDHDPDKTLAFYKEGLLSKAHDVETSAFSAEQITNLFLDDIVVNYDFAICETITRMRSPIFENATQASHAILRDYRARRQAEGVQGPFSMRVINSRTIFSGQALLAAYTIDLINKGVPNNELRQRVQAMTDSIYSYAAPPDIYYLRERARRRGDTSITSFAAFLGKTLEIVPIVCGRNDTSFPVAKVRGYKNAVEKLFDYAIRQMERGLLFPYICLTYTGDAAELPSLPGYDKLAAAAKEYHVQLLNTMASITTGVYLGPGTVGLSLAALPHQFDE